MNDVVREDLAWIEDQCSEELRKHCTGKVIYLCSCKKGKKIKNKYSYLVTPVEDNQCPYCKKYVVTLRVRGDWKPSQGIHKPDIVSKVSMDSVPIAAYPNNKKAWNGKNQALKPNVNN